MISTRTNEMKIPHLCHIIQFILKEIKHILNVLFMVKMLLENQFQLCHLYNIHEAELHQVFVQEVSAVFAMVLEIMENCKPELNALLS